MSKTTGGKSNVDTRLGEEIEVDRAKLTRWSKDVIKIKTIEAQRSGVNGGREKPI